jgi:hypothetical protein
MRARKSRCRFGTPRARGAQLDAAIISGLGLVAIYSVDPRFVDTDDPVDEIDVGDREGDLLRRSQSGEEPEFVVVSLRLANPCEWLRSAVPRPARRRDRL